MSDLVLDDLIYCLQRTILPEDLSLQLTQADIHYLQGRDFEALLSIGAILNICKARGIAIYRPINCQMYA